MVRFKWSAEENTVQHAYFLSREKRVYDGVLERQVLLEVTRVIQSSRVFQADTWLAI